MVKDSVSTFFKLVLVSNNEFRFRKCGTGSVARRSGRLAEQSGTRGSGSSSLTSLDEVFNVS
eukprot:15333541-Alexandrium_andersonii.AAC.1